MTRPRPELGCCATEKKVQYINTTYSVVVGIVNASIEQWERNVT
jgi:hypothetical protein